MKNIIFTFITVTLCFVFTETLIAIDVVAPPPPIPSPVEPTGKDAKDKDIEEYSVVLKRLEDQQHGNLVPTVDSFSPTSGEKEAEVTFTGTYLDLLESIKFEDVLAIITSQSETEIEVDVPDLGGEQRSVEIIVTTASTGATTTLSPTFLFEVREEDETPNITSYPNRGKKNQKLDFRGTNLLSIKDVKFNNTVAKIDNHPTDTLIKVQVPNWGNSPISNVTITIISTTDESIILTTTFYYTGNRW